MINIEIKNDIRIFKSGEEIVISQKKLRAILAFFVIEKSVDREEVAKIFFEGNKNPIRNSIYMINKLIGEDVISNVGRNTIALNKRIEFNTDIDYKNFLVDLKFKNEPFFKWKQSKIRSEYYVNQELLNTVYFNYMKAEPSHYLINGKNGVGKTEFISKLYDIVDNNKIRVKCTQNEQYFSLNIIYIIIDYLRKFENKDFLKVFTDINYNDKKAFKDENNLLNLYYLPITELLINILSEELTHKYLIMVEDLEYIDESSLTIINKIIEKKLPNLTFVMTYNTTSKRDIHVSSWVKNHIISNWNKEEVKNYLEYYHANYLHHLDVIYESTKGNPFYIEVMINNLIHSNTLSLSRDYLADTFKCLNDVESMILKYVSCFNGSVYLDDIYIVFLVNDDVIEHLKSLNILETRVVHNVDKVYFKHSILKEYIYNNLESQERRQFHSIIAEKIEKNFKSDKLIKVYELYHHFSSAENLVKSTQYKIKYLSLVSSYTHSVFPLTDRFDFITDEHVVVNKIKDEINELEAIFNENVILRTNNKILIDFYTLKNRYDIIIGEIKDTKENILKHIELCKVLNDESELTKAYYIMIYHALNIGDHQLVDEYLNNLNTIFSIEENPITKRIQGYNYILKREYHKSIFTLNEALDLSYKLSKELAEANLVACYAYLGEAHIITHDYKRALKDLKRGEKIVSESANYISGSILIKLFTAISHYRLGNTNLALEYITEAYKQYDKNDLSWKKCSCYLYARQIYRDCGLEYEFFNEKIRKCSVKYHSDLGKWLYNEFLKEESTCEK